jgi:hypothetical protein
MILKPLPAILLFLAVSPVTAGSPPALFISINQLDKVRSRLNQAPYAGQFSTLIGLANSYLGWTASPFQMTEIDQIRYGWCVNYAQAPDDTLRDLTEKLRSDSDRIRNLALAGLLTGNTEYYRVARTQLMAWVNQSTLVNLYDLGIDFSSAMITGATTGYCSDRPWNFALDTMWQGYGLINFSDAYIILSRNWDGLTEAEDAAIRSWLRKLAAATNSGFHAWTRWADLHKSSSAFTGYRSDNHLSWALAGITAAAAALQDPVIWNYVLAGGTWDDGKSGPYANPSHLRDLIDRAIYSNGKIYDQNARAAEYKGFFYGCFHLWALSIVTQITEVHRGESFWNHAGADGGTLSLALDYYAPYVAADVSIPDANETTDPKFFRFIYEIPATKTWAVGLRGVRFIDARDVAPRDQLISQAIGPVTLLLGDHKNAEFDLGKLTISRNDQGNLSIILPPSAYGSELLSSPDLKEWTPVPGFDPNVDTSLEIPARELSGPPRFFKARR